MAKISYRYEFPEGNSDPDHPPPLIIEVQSLASEIFRELPEYLINNIDLRHDTNGIDTHLDARPVEIEFSDQVRISERTFWTIVIDSHDGAVDVIARYLDALITTTKDDHDLAFCVFNEVVGSQAIYAYFDMYLENSHSEDETNLLVMFDCFKRYMEHCDLDHEYTHLRYIQRILAFLKQNDHKRFIDLLSFWMDNNQEGARALPFKLVSKSGVMKTLVDHLLSKGMPGWSLRVDVLELCATIYGTNYELTADVLEYCRSRSNLGEGQTLINFQQYLGPKRLQRDIDFARYPKNLDTGFHRYDNKKGVWSVLLPEMQPAS